MISKNILLPIIFSGVFFTFSAISMNMGMKKKGLVEDDDTLKYSYKVYREGYKILARAYLDGIIDQPEILVIKNTKNKDSRNDDYARRCTFYKNANGSISIEQLGQELEKLVDKIAEFEKAELGKDKKDREEKKEEKESKQDLSERETIEKF